MLNWYLRSWDYVSFYFSVTTDALILGSLITGCHTYLVTYMGHLLASRQKDTLQKTFCQIWSPLNKDSTVNSSLKLNKIKDPGCDKQADDPGLASLQYVLRFLDTAWRKSSWKWASSRRILELPVQWLPLHLHPFPNPRVFYSQPLLFT